MFFRINNMKKFPYFYEAFYFHLKIVWFGIIVYWFLVIDLINLEIEWKRWYINFKFDHE